MNKLDAYFTLQKEIFDYFGYVKNWRILPIDDARDYFWILNQNSDGTGAVIFAETEEILHSDGDYYESPIYTQRHLPRWVYRGKDLTMIVVDTQTDGNKLLQIFDNAKERGD